MASIIKVDTIQDQDGNNIINENANTITIGKSGDTVQVASGAEFVGGGTLWQSAKTGNFTAVAGEGYFVDTATVGAVTATLPSSPSLGDEVTFVDQKYNFNTNALTVGRNGSNIARASSDLVVNTQGAAFCLVFSGDATTGWTYKDK